MISISFHFSILKPVDIRSLLKCKTLGLEEIGFLVLELEVLYTAFRKAFLNALDYLLMRSITFMGLKS